jgi:membrane fusion protein
LHKTPARSLLCAGFSLFSALPLTDIDRPAVKPTSLFRPEAIQGRQQAWLGSIQLIRPVSLGVLTTLVLAVAVIVGAVLVEGRYTRKAHVTGYLVPDKGVLRLLPQQAGTVLERRVTEGQSVRQGDILFVLSTDRATLAGDTQATVQTSLAARGKSLQEAARQKALLQHEQRAGFDRQLDELRRELVQLDAEADLQRQRLLLAQQALTRVESLNAENFISQAQVQAKSEEVLGVQAQMQSLVRQRSAKLRDMGAIESQRRELPIRAQTLQGEIDRDLASLAQESAENQARQRIVIRAPQDGMVTAVLADLGQGVSPAAAVASLLPSDAKLQAHLFAPSSAVGFLRQDQAVQLRYQAFPYQKFGHHAGQVLQVSRSPLQASDLAGLPLPEFLKSTPAAEPLYRITVALDRQAVQAYGQAQPLSPGMQIDADVMLDRRRLIEWIFEPLLSVTGRV